MPAPILPLRACAAGMLALLASPAALAQADERALEVPPVRERLPDGELTVADRRFIDLALARSRLLDDALALAEARASDRTLRALAASMRPSHRALTEGLLTLGGNDTRARALPAIPDEGLEQLRDSRGSAFDRRFVALVLPVQRTLVTRYRQAIEDRALSDPVRRLARQGLPIAQFHLELMQDTRLAGNEAD